MKKTFLGIALVMMLIVNALGAVPTSKVMNGIQKRFDSISDFQSTISQVNVDAIGNKTVYYGEVYFKKPGKIRVVYYDSTRTRTQQIAITDGKYMWIYTAELNQVTKQKFDPKSLPLPLLVLGGASKIDEGFRDKNYIKPIERVTLNGTKALSIIVKPKTKNPDYKEQILWVEEDTYLPVKAQVKDLQDNLSTITFKDNSTDNNLSDSLFVLSPKNGVKWVDLTK
jgi:chaperone LolA